METTTSSSSAAEFKLLAEEKLKEGDISGAKNFAKKALEKFPQLHGLSQLKEVIDVHKAKEKKNWYKVLGIDPSTLDEATISSQYKKLAFKFHPDKNKTFGAAEAFKIVVEAKNVLFHIYSSIQRRRTTNLTRSPPTDESSSSFSPSPPPRSTPSPPPRSNMVWIACSCGMHMQYLRINLNLYLICQDCLESFQAKEVPPPPPPRHTPPPPPPPPPPPSPSPPRYTNLLEPISWAICPHCKCQFQYPKFFADQTLICHNCLESFTEPPPPSRKHLKRPREDSA